MIGTFWPAATVTRFIAAVVFASFLAQAAWPQNAGPHLRKKGNASQLVVNGSPFLALGGELGNSSASSMDYMAPVWPNLQTMHINTVLAPVYWELIEPEEGQFGFSLLDRLIDEARLNGDQTHQGRHLRIPMFDYGIQKLELYTYE